MAEPRTRCDAGRIIIKYSTKIVTMPRRQRLQTLQENNVKFYLCGQSAAAQGIGKGDLLPGVKMALSAMTMHALLDQQGFSLNPF